MIKTTRTHMLHIIIVMVILLTPLFFPTHAQAALLITGVNPHQVSGSQDSTITISGSDFVVNSVVSIDGFGALTTSFFSNTTLMAIVPSGVPIGTYTITVTNPGLTTASLPDSLEVIAQAPTAAITLTSQPPANYQRPVVVVDSYDITQSTISPGDYFTLNVTLYNAGQQYARNTVATFTPGDLIPRETGGVIAVGEIAPGNHMDFSQSLFLSTDAWVYVASINMLLTYTDESGILYNETFVISLPVYLPYTGSSTSTATPTVTPTALVKPQLVITSYSSDVAPLQPGNIFNLSLFVTNMGATSAKHVTMIVGGGAVRAEMVVPRCPVGFLVEAVNLQILPPLAHQTSNRSVIFHQAAPFSLQPLIVNTSTAPGAYPLKISFVYSDDQNHSFIDDQVITLLVYRLPMVDISFYQELPPLFTGQMNMLPLQVVNLGRNSVVLGNMRVSADTGQFSNSSILVGNLEPGGYFTMDAMYMPDQVGPVDLLLTIDYTNDFNQSQVITKTIPVDVMEQPIIEPPIDGGTNGGEIPITQPETFLQKVWRFVLGLIGLDSGVSSPQPPSDSKPVETIVPEGQPIVVPAQPIKGP